MAGTSSDSSPGFELKGEMSMLTVFKPLSGDLEQITRGLTDKVAQTSELFRQLPVVIDLQTAPEAVALALDLRVLAEMLRNHGLVPVGVRGMDAERHDEVQAAGLGVLHAGAGSAARTESRAKTVDNHANGNAGSQAGTVLVERPVRSGQQVVAPKGDLVVVGAASPGSELLAAGSIHVYGSLRGRALAGVSGNREARIFCLRMEAELLSIAGCYQLLEERQEQMPGPVRIKLEGERLRLDSV